MMKLIIFLTTFFALSTVVFPQNATVREFEREIKTYPFSDPDPIPRVGRIYPYFRFDGYSGESTMKKWKVIEIENEFIKVWIFPEIGGKIWTAIDKKKDKPFLYNNHVVKFRDIAMRGPWTSGGIEANYGIIGHTPTVSTPVDYLTRTNPDGSASVFIGALDLLTRTSWQIEINLPKDKAYFTTRSFWMNPTNLRQPYYTWMNAAIPARDDLQFIYPGNSFMGHGGEFGEWKFNSKEKKDISFYRNNDFGGYKSYHVFGKYTEFFGAFYHDEDFGMVRYSTHDDKPGKKLWIWGLSRQGMIWKDLLTDSDGQYVEVQSGRLFNQTARDSMFTPFKFRGFTPYESDTWKEYWFPVQGTKGFVAAGEYGALNLKTDDKGISMAISPIRSINENLEIFEGDKKIFSEALELKPLQQFTKTIPGNFAPEKIRVKLGGIEIYNAKPDAYDLSRPKKRPKDLDYDSAYGLYLQAVALIYDRGYAEAEEKLDRSLEKEPNFIPALTAAAEIAIRKMEYKKAFDLARKALSVDTYDGAANFYYAVAAQKLGKIFDAKDGFDLASGTTELRTAAFTELAKIYFREGNKERAQSYAEKALIYNSENLEAYRVLAVSAKSAKALEVYLSKIASVASLDHFPAAMHYLNAPSENSRKAFVSMIRNELPHETYLELAIWFYNMGLTAQADSILALSLANAETAYWRAFLGAKLGSADGDKRLATADKSDPKFVFPFRTESVQVFDWAMAYTTDWKPRYFLSLIYAAHNRTGKARELISCSDVNTGFAPYYAFCAELFPERAKKYLLEAAYTEPAEWRYIRQLVELEIKRGDSKSSIEILQYYAQTKPENYILGMLYAKVLLLNGKYTKSLSVLRKLKVLPYEGAKEGRLLYREANLHLAIEAVREKKFDEALRYISEAKVWMEDLGAGKPYDADIDLRLEDFLESIALRGKGKTAEADAALKRVEAKGFIKNSVLNILLLAASRTFGKEKTAVEEYKRFLVENPDDHASAWALKAFQNGIANADESFGDEDNIRLLLAMREILK